jgi:site-specific DNA-methyltransferase (cytosine-N4-specific)
MPVEVIDSPDNPHESAQIGLPLSWSAPSLLPSMSEPKKKVTKFREALSPKTTPPRLFESDDIKRVAYYADKNSIVINSDALTGLRRLADAQIQVDCIVTSPPFYGQRDYDVAGQLGLELHPSEFLAKLIEIFEACRPVLRPTGSLWVNLGDTYWSGKGEHRSAEKKQSARRFGLRPQDRKGDGMWCRPKQLLLLPHRFAVAMQEAGWLVRNDNVWVKPNPIPDQVNDRCSMSHEYVFHFVKERYYFFDRRAVGRASSNNKVLPPQDTWIVRPSRGNGFHKASFSTELIDLPIRATTPKRGIVLDPFAGSGTSLLHARHLGYRHIGIDIKPEFCKLMVAALQADTTLFDD